MSHARGSGGGMTPVSIGPRLLIDTEEVAPGVTKVNLRGRLDANGVQTISTTFDRVARTQSQLIVDLSRVTLHRLDRIAHADQCRAFGGIARRAHGVPGAGGVG